MELPEEIRALAEQVAACPDDTVANLAADAAKTYRKERLLILGLAAVDSMIDGSEINENDPRLLRVQEELRDRLKGLVAWGQASGRMP